MIFPPNLVLPVQLQPNQLRPIAYRVLSKKYGLNLKSCGLKVLADYVGRRFGVDWKKQADLFLDEVARQWREQDRGVFLDEQILRSVIKEVELRHGELKYNGTTTTESNSDDPKRSGSFTISKTPEQNLFVIDAFKHPKWVYNPQTRQFERSTRPPSLFPPTSQFVELQVLRYNLLYHRLLRNDKFQQPSFNGPVIQPGGDLVWRPVTMINNLLGRTGRPFLLFGILSLSEDGPYYLEDPTGKIELDLTNAKKTLGHFAPGCFILADGIYGRNEKFAVHTLGHPPCERQDRSWDVFGFVDLLGISGGGSVPGGRFDRELIAQMQQEEVDQKNSKIVILGFDIFLDKAETLNKLNRIFTKFETQSSDEKDRISLPLAILLFGNFSSRSFQPDGNARRYKSYFDTFAAEVISKHPQLCSYTKLIFIPGNGDPWTSAYSMGTDINTMPQKGIPEILRNRVLRATRNAVFSSNPCRIAYFSQEIVAFRDGLAGRLLRNSLFLPEADEVSQNSKSDEVQQLMQIDIDNDNSNNEPLSRVPDIDVEVHEAPNDSSETGVLATKQSTIADGVKSQAPNKSILSARRLTRTILDQGTLSPFPMRGRPILADYDHTFRLVPLPKVLILADDTAPEFKVVYEGCLVVNPGRFDLTNKSRQMGWYEYSPSSKTCQKIIHYY